MDFPKAAAVIGGKTGTVPALARTPHGFPTRRPIQHRLRDVENQDGARAQGQELHPIAGVRGQEALSLRVLDYVALVDWSGRVVREGKRGALDLKIPR
jgi:hypothetical protein